MVIRIASESDIINREAAVNNVPIAAICTYVYCCDVYIYIFQTRRVYSEVICS